MENLVIGCTYITFCHSSILFTYKCNNNNREKEIMNGKTEIMDILCFSQIYRNIFWLLSYLLNFYIIVRKRKEICNRMSFMNNGLVMGNFRILT